MGKEKVITASGIGNALLYVVLFFVLWITSTMFIGKIAELPIRNEILYNYKHLPERCWEYYRGTKMDAVCPEDLETLNMTKWEKWIIWLSGIIPAFWIALSWFLLIMIIRLWERSWGLFPLIDNWAERHQEFGNWLNNKLSPKGPKNTNDESTNS